MVSELSCLHAVSTRLIEMVDANNLSRNAKLEELKARAQRKLHAEAEKKARAEARMQEKQDQIVVQRQQKQQQEQKQQQKQQQMAAKAAQKEQQMTEKAAQKERQLADKAAQKEQRLADKAAQKALKQSQQAARPACGKGRKLPQMPAIAASQGQVAMGQQQDPATAQIPADAMLAQVAELEGLADVSVAHCMHPPEISGYHGCSASHTSAATRSTSDLPQASTPDGKRRRRLPTANNVATHAPVAAAHAEALGNSRHARKRSRPAHLQDFE